MNYKPSPEQIELICRLRCEVEGLDPDETIEVVTHPPQPMNREGTAFLAVYISPTRENMPRWKSKIDNVEQEAIQYNIMYDVLDPASFLAKQRKHPCGCPAQENVKPVINDAEDVAQLELWLVNEANIITLGYFPQLPDHKTVINNSEYIQCEIMKHVQVVACTLSKEITASYHFSDDCGVTWYGPITWEQIMKADGRAKQKNPTATAVNPNTPLKGN